MFASTMNTISALNGGWAGPPPVRGVEDELRPPLVVGADAFVLVMRVFSLTHEVESFPSPIPPQQADDAGSFGASASTPVRPFCSVTGRCGASLSRRIPRI